MDSLKVGDKFTMAGVGYGPKGEFVVNGHTADGKPCEVVTLRVYTAMGFSNKSVDNLKKHVENARQGYNSP